MVRNKLGLGTCHYCGEHGQTTDHIVPRVLGGPNKKWNYVISCMACNGKKGSRWPTCDCEKCIEAVKLFLEMPGKREYAMKVLDARDGVMVEAIKALTDKAAYLETRRVRNKDLIERIRGLYIEP